MNVKTITGKSFRIPLEFGNYNVVRQIGRGGTSTVVLVRTKKGSENRAVKIISREELVRSGMLLPFEQELRVHQNLNHPNIVKLYEVVYDENNIYVVMEHCGNGELLNWISDSFSLGSLKLRKSMYQILQAINYLHGRDIAHMDIKPENILFDSAFNVKLADFGCCVTNVPRVSGDMFGTIMYTAPEVIKGNLKDLKKADIWSTGVVFFAMATGRLPWSGGNLDEIAKNIVTQNVVIPNELPPEIYAIINMCLQKNPDDRPSASELLNRAFFDSERNLTGPTTNSRSVPVIPSKRIFRNSLVIPKVPLPSQLRKPRKSYANSQNYSLN